MEQLRNHILYLIQSFQNNFLIFFIVFVSFVGISGCEKEIPNPETLDPIHKDLLSILDLKEKELKDELKKLEDLTKNIGLQPVRSLGLKTHRRDIKKSKITIKKLEQDILYFKIHSERRRLEARKAYRIAFSKKEKWPDPNEHNKYLTSKRLKEAPRSWGKRIQKLLESNPALKASN